MSHQVALDRVSMTKKKHGPINFIVKAPHRLSAYSVQLSLAGGPRCLGNFLLIANRNRYVF